MYHLRGQQRFLALATYHLSGRNLPASSVNPSERVRSMQVLTAPFRQCEYVGEQVLSRFVEPVDRASSIRGILPADENFQRAQTLQAPRQHCT